MPIRTPLPKIVRSSTSCETNKKYISVCLPHNGQKVKDSVFGLLNSKYTGPRKASLKRNQDQFTQNNSTEVSLTEVTLPLYSDETPKTVKS